MQVSSLHMQKLEYRHNWQGGLVQQVSLLTIRDIKVIEARKEDRAYGQTGKKFS